MKTANDKFTRDALKTREEVYLITIQPRFLVKDQLSGLPD